MIQVDTLCHKIPNFVEKAKRAGVTRVFIGLENINPDNLAAAKKRQNKITEYRKMLLAWKAQGIITIAGYILGFPADTPETIRRDIAIIQRELPLDIIEFFCLTPLPGSEDHQVLWKDGVEMDPDLNIYDVEHVCTSHPQNEQAGSGRSIYREAWSLYYSPEHMRTLSAPGGGDRRARCQSGQAAGDFRDLRSPREHAPAADRHPAAHPPIGAPARPAARKRHVFWPRLAWRTLRNNAIIAGRIVSLVIAAKLIRRQADSASYMDEALTPVKDGDELLDLMTMTTGGLAAAAHLKKIARLTAGAKREPVL